MKKHLKPLLKLAVIYVLRFVMRVLSIFPIRKNRIVINSYRGEQYSCNPKYISQGLQKMYPEKYEIIWAFKNPGKYYDLKKSGIKLVSFASIKRFYYEATAKISINNIGSYSWMPVRKGQEHINTWHGAVDYKKVALSEINNDAVMKKTLLMSARETTLSPQINFSLNIVFQLNLDTGEKYWNMVCPEMMHCIFVIRRKQEIELSGNTRLTLII